MKIGQDYVLFRVFTLLLLAAFVICIYAHFKHEEGHYIFLVLAFLIIVAYFIYLNKLYREFKDWQKQNQEVKLAGTNNEGIA